MKKRRKKRGTRSAPNPAGVRVVHNKLLGGWYVVRGPHHTPLNGRFNSKAEALAWLAKPSKDPWNLTFHRVTGRNLKRNPSLVVFGNPKVKDWQCQECGARLTLRQAQRAVNQGCPKCGGYDIDQAPLGNPGGRVLSKSVIEIRYRHADDGELYRHTFKRGQVQIVTRAGSKTATLRRVDGKPLISEY